MPEINIKLCDGCGLCITVCSGEALVLVNNVATIIKGASCDYCALCELVCPTGAIMCPYEMVIEED